MDQRLYDAARAGDVDALHALRSADPLILNKICLSHFAETPLHVATLAGQTEFAKEIIRLMPSFAKELNKDGFAPMHVASARGDEGIVMELLKLDTDRSLCLQRDNSGQIPLHYAVVRGRIPVIEMLISHCTESLQQVTAVGETALHLAVKNSQFEALKVVLKRLKELECFETVLSTKDNKGRGKTIVELAQATKQVQVVELLKEYQNGHTDDEIMEEKHQIEIFSDAQTDGKQNEKQESKKEGNIDKDNLVLVAAVLIATVTYQALLTPPSSIWKENVSLNPRCMFKISFESLQQRKRDCPAMMYYYFMLFNSAGFFSSVALILTVTSSYAYMPLQLLLTSILVLLCNYIVLIMGQSPDILSFLAVTLVPDVIVLLFFLFVRFIRKHGDYFRQPISKWLKKYPKLERLILFLKMAD